MNKIRVLLKKIMGNKTIKPFNIKKAKVVILGTHPGEKSLEKKEYYSNPQNQFWELTRITEKDYEKRLEKLKEKEIGLWDVIMFCDRDGSADKNIKNEVYNNLSLLKDKRVFFNGKKAYEYYIKANKKHKFNLNISKSNILPSSNRACAIKNKKQKWNKIFTI